MLLTNSSLITLYMYTFTAPYSWKKKLAYHLPLLLHLVGIEQKLFSRSKHEFDKVITLFESSSDSDQTTLVRCFNAGALIQLWASIFQTQNSVFELAEHCLTAGFRNVIVAVPKREVSTLWVLPARVSIDICWLSADGSAEGVWRFLWALSSNWQICSSELQGAARFGKAGKLPLWPLV